MDAMTLGSFGVGVALAPATKPIALGVVQPLIPAQSGTGPTQTQIATSVISLVASGLGMAALWYNQKEKEDVIDYVGAGLIGLGVGYALDAPQPSGNSYVSPPTPVAVTVNRHIAQQVSRPTPQRFGLSGSSILV